MEVGFATLRSILECGLLLTPEDLSIPPNQDSDLSNPPRTTVLQRRACFTYLDRAELLRGEHAALFGNFAIGVDTAEARRLGIVPTFYYYRSTPDGAGSAPDARISEEVLFRLAEVRRLLIAVAHIEATASPDDPKVMSREYLHRFGMHLDDERDVRDALARLDPRHAKTIVSVLNTDRLPAWNLVEWIEIILSMFQTADSAYRGRHLAYYSQREWRVIQLFAEGLACFPLDPTRWKEDRSLDIRAQALLSAARASIQEILDLARSQVRVDDCFLLIGSESLHFREFVSEIVVPASVEERTTELLEEMGLDERFKKAESRGGTSIFERRGSLRSVGAGGNLS